MICDCNVNSAEVQMILKYAAYSNLKNIIYGQYGNIYFNLQVNLRLDWIAYMNKMFAFWFLQIIKIA